MASVHRKKGSKFWHGAFSMPDGKRRLRSTKETDKTKALQIVLAWERASRIRATTDQAQRVLADIVRVVSGDEFESVTFHQYSERWIERKRAEVSEQTLQKYKTVVRDLKLVIPEHAAMAHVTTTALVNVRDRIAERTSVSTANQAAKIIKILWGNAFNDGLIPENSADRLVPLSTKKHRQETPERRPFQINEIERLLATLSPEDEWFGMILLGVYSGQRLGDIARAKREQIHDGIWAFRSQKTGLDLRVALAEPVLHWLEKQGPKSGFLFPKHAAIPRTGTMSNRFYAIMARAGLVPRRPHRKKKDAGTSNKRQLSEIGFHCFRHTTQTWLMEAGATRELAMAHVGHEDEKTSRGYTHISVEALRDVVRTLPDVRFERSESTPEK